MVKGGDFMDSIHRIKNLYNLTIIGAIKLGYFLVY